MVLLNDFFNKFVKDFVNKLVKDFVNKLVKDFLNKPIKDFVNKPVKDFLNKPATKQAAEKRTLQFQTRCEYILVRSTSAPASEGLKLQCTLFFKLCCQFCQCCQYRQ